MRGGRERWRPSSKRRIPRRGTDWVEDVAAGSLVCLAFLAVVLSTLVGLRVHGGLLDRARQEAATRGRVQAVVPRDATPLASAVGLGTSLAAQVPVRYLDTDGVVRETLASADGTPRVGDAIRIWVDRDHHIVPQPTDADDATAAGYVAGGVALFVSLTGLILARYGVGQLAVIRNRARWEREWAVVEPLWSGQTFGGGLS